MSTRTWVTVAPIRLRRLRGVPASPAAAVEVRDLVMRYGDKTAVDGLRLDVARATITAVLGPNGAGKTTTLETCEGYRRPQQGTVRVLVSTGDGHAELCVGDTGAGLDPAFMHHMFQPFSQAEQTLARTAGGLGLGLALVKGLVELHGGTVEARSEGVGRGAEFVVRLPLAH